MLDQAIGKIKKWDLQFIEFDDRPKGFLRNLHRAITRRLVSTGRFREAQTRRHRFSVGCVFA